jgi:hypothetical protein
MGNQNSQQFTQSGAGYTDNFNGLQNKIESLVVNSKKNNFTETINFSNSSDLDLDSIRDQDGGFDDKLTVKSRRFNYLNFVHQGPPPSDMKGGSNNTMELSSIDEKDFQILKDILKQHQTGGNLLNTEKNILEFSDTSPQPVNFSNKFSPTSQSDQIGGNLQTFSPTSNSEIANGNACTIPSHVSQAGGCGCNDVSTSPNDIRKPTYFKSLIGGGEDEESEEESEEESNDENSDDEEDEDEDDEETEEDDEDDDHDEGSDGDELARSKSSSESDKKKKHRKQKRHSEYIETTDDDDELSGGSSEEHTLTKKYIYSDHDTFYGSDDNSEYYKHIKNRSMVN